MDRENVLQRMEEEITIIKKEIQAQSIIDELGLDIIVYYDQRLGKMSYSKRGDNEK